MQETVRFPRRVGTQSAILIAWPNADTDWAERLAEVEETYIALVAAITRFQRVVICVADDDVETYAEMRLRSNRIDMERVRFVTVPYDDTWLRDSGPIALRVGDGFRLLDFRFTGWAAVRRQRRRPSVERLTAQGRVRHAGSAGHRFRAGRRRHRDRRRRRPAHHLAVPARTPSRRLARGTDQKLAGWLQQERVLWLDHGALEATTPTPHRHPRRFAPGNAIVFQACDDEADSHYADLKAMAGRDRRAAHQAMASPYRLFPLPWAQPVIDIAEDGSRRAWPRATPTS